MFFVSKDNLFDVYLCVPPMGRGTYFYVDPVSVGVGVTRFLHRRWRDTFLSCESAVGFRQVVIRIWHYVDFCLCFIFKVLFIKMKHIFTHQITFPISFPMIKTEFQSDVGRHKVCFWTECP